MRTLTLPPLNPVLARELKQRMRGRLTWLVVTGYLAVLALILRFVYLGASQSFSGSNFGDPLASASVGRSIFHWLLFFMMMLVCFIVPGLTASAISGERERQTLVSLQVTLLRPRSIVLGKLLSSLAFTSFLVVASLPLLSVPFLVGGVSVTEVVKGVVMILATALVLAILAVACSALLRRTQAATVVAYGLTAALTIGTFIVYGGQRAMDGPVDKASPAILALNPFVATADVVQGRNQNESFGSPFTAIVDMVRPELSGFGPEFGDPGLPIDIRRQMAFEIREGMAVPAPPFTVGGPPMSQPAEASAGPPSTSADSVPVGPVPDATAGVVVGVVGSTNDPPVMMPDIGSDQVFIDGSGVDFQVGQPFSAEDFRPRNAEVLGLRLWVAWLVGSAILGGLAILLSVRRVRLPSKRDSS